MKTESPIFKVGDSVTTDFSGRTTKHKITRVEPDKYCESGWMYWTKPRIGCASPVDQGWLRKDGDLNKQTGGGCE